MATRIDRRLLDAVFDAYEEAAGSTP